MKTKKYIILILFCISGLFQLKGAPDFYAGSLFRKRLVKSDTSELNRQIRAAIEAASKPEIMKAHIDTAELICNKSNVEIPALLHLARAEYFSGINDFKDALTEANIALKLAKNTRDDETLIKTYTYLGYYYLKTRMFNEGIYNFLNSIETARKSKLKGYIPAAYYGLSNLHFETGSIEKQRSTLLLALTSAEKEKDSMTLNRTYYELGSSYADKNPTDHILADSLLKAAFRLALARKDKNLLALSLANLGWNSYLMKDYNEAIRYYEQSLKISLPEQYHGASANAFGNLGTIYRDIGKHDLAIKYYKLSIDQSKAINYIYNLAWVYKDMSDMYLQQADTGRAYLYLVQHKEYSDKQLSTTNSTGLLQAKLRYDAETQKKEVELLSLRVNNQKLLIFGSTGLLVLSVTILILLLSRAKIMAKRKISEMNRKVAEVTQANLRQQMNPHFIFNTLNSIQYYMYQHDKLS
ncbi:MAG TPA: tetratricopeptide repeat protein, partial [Bacteroidales bacterium]|nr:tetratricopeptide repeat protein [Bacteroidales bacterium]